MFLFVDGCVSYSSPPPSTPTGMVYQTFPKPTSQAIRLVIGDGGLLSGEPCGPPCFWDIYPGKTTKDEAQEILTRRGFIDYCKTFESFQYVVDREVETGGWACRIGFGFEFDIDFIKDVGIVNFIRFEPEKRLMLQDVIGKFGSPKFIDIFNTGSENHPSQTLWATIYYPDQMFMLSVVSKNGLTYPIEPTTVINHVIYQDAQLFETTFALAGDDFYPWKGYGDYP